MVTGSCVCRETTRTGRPRLVRAALYLSICTCAPAQVRARVRQPGTCHSMLCGRATRHGACMVHRIAAWSTGARRSSRHAARAMHTLRCRLHTLRRPSCTCLGARVPCACPIAPRCACSAPRARHLPLDRGRHLVRRGGRRALDSRRLTSHEAASAGRGGAGLGGRLVGLLLLGLLLVAHRPRTGLVGTA